MNDKLKRKLREGEYTYGIMLSELYVPNIARLIGTCGYDFLLIDCEHGYFDLTQTANLITAAESVDLPVVVRVPAPDRAVVTKYMDMGARGILLANTKDAAAAQELADMCLYTPEGRRGISTFRAHSGYQSGNTAELMRSANRCNIVICQIESPEAVEDADNILAVEGVDGVLVGPNDLSQHMGIFGQEDSPLLREALERVAKAAKKAGKFSGIITAKESLITDARKCGMTCFSVGSELNALASGAKKQLAKARAAISEGWGGYEINEALLARGGETPVINTNPLPRYHLKNLDYGMTIGVAATKGGRLFVCWVAGGDNSKAYFLVAKSDDGGENWSQPILAIDPHDESLPCDRSTIVGDLWTDPEGRLFLFFNQSLAHFDGRSTDWFIRCDDPDAETPVWTKPQYIWHGETLNKPIVLSGGEWLLPVSLWARRFITKPFNSCWHELDDLRMAHWFVSENRGKTWSRRGGVRVPSAQFDEHMAVELRDGRLWMLSRVSSGLMESFSTDGGATWSEPSRARVQSCPARFHLRRLESGRLLLIKHGFDPENAPSDMPRDGLPAEVEPRRRELTAFLSEDEGETWPYRLMLDERMGVSYPDMCELDGTMYITYDYCRFSRGEILMARITEEDIIAGELVSQNAQLKKLVCRPGKLHPEDWAEAEKD